MKLIRLIKRLLVFPFFFGIMFITHNWFVLKRMYQFLKYGGEATIYKVNDKHSINEIFEIQKEILSIKKEKYK